MSSRYHELSISAIKSTRMRQYVYVLSVRQQRAGSPGLGEGSNYSKQNSRSRKKSCTCTIPLTNIVKSEFAFITETLLIFHSLLLNVTCVHNVFMTMERVINCLNLLFNKRLRDFVMLLVF